MALPKQLKFINILLVLLIIYDSSDGTKNQHEIFLNRQLQAVHNERSVETLFLLHHSNLANCSLQDWNPPRIPTIRSNELNVFNLEKTFNHNALALVCLINNSYIGLLNTLVKSFDCMRQERIILLIHRKPDPSFIEDITHVLKDLQFLHLIVLIVQEKSNGQISASTLRLQSFPEPHFKWIRNVFAIKKIFYRPINFRGKVLNAIPSDIRILFVALTEILTEYVRRYNSTLRIQNRTIKEKIEITQLHNSKNFSHHINFAMDMNSNSLIILVPCGTELRGLDIFKELGVRTLTRLALIFYIIFVLVEMLFVIISNRFNSRNFTMIYTNPLMNLRAIRSILCQISPISNRYSLSIQHFFVFMSLFGTLFGGFFDCKLRSFLTKRPYYSQIENFSELRESGVTVVVDPPTRQFIEDEINANFLEMKFPMYLLPQLKN
ncbi:GM26403 [Drosophila sechellia]|uniref:GM26403 n=1 Tax=Drosophila sechellia TaxID=7238 RepID=B4HE43_DROSE|nr:GM26403 [Drosophila sechellia]